MIVCSSLDILFRQIKTLIKVHVDIDKSSCGLYFWAPDLSIERF